MTDSNGVLSDYSFSSSDSNVSVSKSGNKLTISSTVAISGSVRITAKRNNVPTVSSSAKLIAYGDPNLQDLVNSRLTNLIAMRADGEISKDEYQAMRSPVDEEIKKLQKALDEIPQEKSNPKGLDIEGIRSTLNSFIDFSGSTISHDVVNQFVYLITPTSDTTFDWYVNLNGTADVKATFTAEGRKKNCIIKLEEIEKISSVHREKNEDNAHFIKNPHIFTYLHRQPSRRLAADLPASITIKLNYEQARAYRNSRGYVL